MALDVFFLSKTPAYSVWHYQNNKNMEKKILEHLISLLMIVLSIKAKLFAQKNRFPLIFILNMAIRY